MSPYLFSWDYGSLWKSIAPMKIDIYLMITPSGKGFEVIGCYILVPWNVVNPVIEVCLVPGESHLKGGGTSIFLFPGDNSEVWEPPNGPNTLFLPFLSFPEW